MGCPGRLNSGRRAAIPEFPIFKYHRETGLSKLALLAYDAEGRLIADTGPQYG